MHQFWSCFTSPNYLNLPQIGNAYKIYDDEDVQTNCGRFDDAKLCEIWNTGDDAEKRRELLALMQQFKLCYTLPESPGSYIAPTFLSPDPPDYLQTWDTIDNLTLRFFYPFKPKRLFLNFIVAMHDKIDEQRLMWRHGVVLKDPSSDVRAEVIEDREYRNAEIKIRVSGTGDKRRFLQIVASQLQDIQNRYGDAKRFKYTTQIPCNCSECDGNPEPHFFKWETLERYYNKGITDDRCEKSLEMVNIISLIDNISTWRSDRAKRDDHDRKSEADGRSNLFPSPVEVHNHNYFQPQQTMTQESGRTNITQNHSGSGDNVAGDKNTTNHYNPSPAKTAELLKTLLTDLDLNGNSDRDDLKDELLYQPPAQQNQLWDWMDTVARDLDTRDEAIKTFAEVLGSLFSLPGSITAGAFKVGYTALTKARRKRNELPADYHNPFDASDL